MWVLFFCFLESFRKRGIVDIDFARRKGAENWLSYNSTIVDIDVEITEVIMEYEDGYNSTIVDIDRQ